MGWNDILKNNGSNGSSDKVEFAKIPEGTTRIRILDEEPYSFWQHWLDDHKMSVRCPSDDQCPMCKINRLDKANGDKPRFNNSSRHIARIWNYETNREEILAQGITFWRAIGQYMQELGDVRNYDIKVMRKGTDRSTSYTLLPLPPTVFEHKDQITEVDFDKIFPVYDNEMLLKIMDKGKAAFEDNSGDGRSIEERMNEDDVPF